MSLLPADRVSNFAVTFPALPARTVQLLLPIYRGSEGVRLCLRPTGDVVFPSPLAHGCQDTARLRCRPECTLRRIRGRRGRRVMEMPVGWCKDSGNQFQARLLAYLCKDSGNQFQARLLAYLILSATRIALTKAYLHVNQHNRSSPRTGRVLYGCPK